MCFTALAFRRAFFVAAVHPHKYILHAGRKLFWAESLQLIPGQPFTLGKVVAILAESLRVNNLQQVTGNIHMWALRHAFIFGTYLGSRVVVCHFIFPGEQGAETLRLTLWGSCSQAVFCRFLAASLRLNSLQHTAKTESFAYALSNTKTR